MVHSIPFPLSVSLASTALSLIPSLRRKTQVLRVQTTTRPKRLNFVFRIACEYKNDVYIVDGEDYARAITARLPADLVLGHVVCVYDSQRNFIVLAENRAGAWEYLYFRDITFFSKDGYVMLLNRTLYGKHLERDPTYFRLSRR